MPGTTTDSHAAYLQESTRLYAEMQAAQQRLHDFEAAHPLAFDGAELRKRRQAMNLTQKEFGRIVGIHPSTISRLERGSHKDITALTFISLQHVLGCQFETLLHH